MAGRRCYFGDHPSITHTVSKKGVLTRAASAWIRPVLKAAIFRACFRKLVATSSLSVDDGGDAVPGLALETDVAPHSRSELVRMSGSGTPETIDLTYPVVGFLGKGGRSRAGSRSLPLTHSGRPGFLSGA